MKYCYIIFVYILSSLLMSCGNMLLINGTYRGKDNPHVFIFSEDSTFNYEYHAMWYSESSGTWRKTGNIIYLNSFNQTDKIPIKYTKTTSEQDSVIRINVEVNSPDKPQRDYICFPVLNKNISHFFYTMERGSYSIESETSIDSMYFVVTKQPFVLRGTGIAMGYDDVKTETIYPHLSVGESINVTINIVDSLFGYKVFKEKKLEIQGGKVIFKEENKKYKLSLRK